MTDKSAPQKLGFRAKLTNFKSTFKRELSPTPSQSGAVRPSAAGPAQTGLQEPPSATTVAAAIINPRIEPGQRIYDAAVRGLEDEDRNTINTIKLHRDVTDFKAVQDAILAKQRLCEEQKWTIKVRDYTLGLGVVAEFLGKLVDLIDLTVELISNVVSVVQPGIDLAATLDPMYIGLAVTAFKAILGVTVFFHDQMQKLFSGIKTATYMVRQMSLYFEYFKQVNSPGAKNLEDVLSESYTLLFEFVAIGYRALQKRGPKRAWELLWSQDKINDFEKNCTAAGAKLETAANLCSRHDTLSGLEKIDRALAEMRKLDVVAATISALDVKVDLQRLRPASAAAYDFVDSNKEGTIYDYCLPGTRQKLIAEITAWCHQPDQTVFWISGMAGTGKSTLIRTAAQQIEAEGVLAGSFFFRQDIAAQSSGAYFTSTIVAQLLKKYPLLRPHVAAALDADLTLPGGPMSNQFDKLLIEPLSKAGLHKLVIVIDALDECRPSDAQIILVQLARLASDLDLRIIITSRPETHLRSKFLQIRLNSIRLEDVNEEVEADIRFFCKSCFDKLGEEDAKKQAPRLTGWPDNATIEQVVQLTTPLFIFAATIIRYISEYRPKERLAAILHENQSSTVTTIDRVYLPIPQQVYGEKDRQVVADFKQVVGSIVLLENPLSIKALSMLLSMQPGDVEEVLEPLHSVLSIQNDIEAPVRILHKSFKDFLLESQHEFRIDRTLINQSLEDGCLTIMNNELRQDICRVERPGTRRDGQSSVESHIQPALAYACLYWVAHVQEPFRDIDAAYVFLQRHFLHWLEALSWLGRVSSAIGLVTRLQTITKDNTPNRGDDANGGSSVTYSTCTDILDFLIDALRFVQMNRYVVDLAPLQVYYSALIFSPTNSLVRRTFQNAIPSIFQILPKVDMEWTAEIQALQGHRGRVKAVAFSLQGTQLASAGEDGTVRLWDVDTGEELHTLRGHAGVAAVGFLFDGRLISGSRDGTTRLWDVTTGEQKCVFPGYEIETRYWAYSIHGLVASALEDGTVRVLDMMTGEEKYSFEGVFLDPPSLAFAPDGQEFDDPVPPPLAFSPDGQELAVGLHAMVRFFEAKTGKEIRYKQLLDGGGRRYPRRHYNITAVAMSLDGSLSAAADRGTINLWNTRGDERRKERDGHLYTVYEGDEYTIEYTVRDLQFSHDNKLLAITSSDGRVRLWEVATGNTKPEIGDRADPILAATFSPDSQLLALASWQGSIRLRNIGLGEQQKTQWKGGSLIAMRFSHDGNLLLSTSLKSQSQVWPKSQVWDVLSGEVKWQLEPRHDEKVWPALSADGKSLVSGLENETRVWNASSGELKCQFVHQRKVIWLSVSPDGRYTASCFQDMVEVWDTTTKSLAATSPVDNHVYGHDFVGTNILRIRSLFKSSHSDIELPHHWTAAEAFQVDESTITSSREWMRYKGEDLLWLPPDYQGSDHKDYHVGKRMVVPHGQTLAIGQRLGNVIFIRLAA